MTNPPTPPSAASPDTDGLVERLMCADYGASDDLYGDAADRILALQDRVRELEEALDEAVARWQASLRSTTNDYGLLACPECNSLHAPYPYWWQRGQAWIIICSNCGHEESREASEGEARAVWNKAAEIACQALSRIPGHRGEEGEE